MNFYCVYGDLYSNISERVEHFKIACHKLNINFIAMSSIESNYCNLPKLYKGDMLYNLGRGSENLESLLINPDVTTFYRKIIDNRAVNSDTNDISLSLQKQNISSPKTIYNSTNNRNQLKNYITFLGGFPVIIKTKGGSLGIGIIMICNYESLFSITDFLCSTSTEFIVREYIVPKVVGRLIVVGNEVIASNSKYIPKDDFRTSVRAIPPKPMVFPKHIEDIAIKSTHCANFETGGVDIVINQEGKGYVLEVNMPHDFVTSSKVVGVDIAQIMLKYLLNKSQNK